MLSPQSVVCILRETGERTAMPVRRAEMVMLMFTPVILSLIFGAIVDAHTTNRSYIAVTGAASVKGGTSGSAPWGFIVGIGAAIAIFVVGGLFIVLRARREYLDEQARQAAKAPDDD
jgi:hypothetical protein